MLEHLAKLMPEPLPASDHVLQAAATATADQLLPQQQRFNNPCARSTDSKLPVASQASFSGGTAAGMAIAPSASPRATALQEHLG
ncbi:hypothetical protein [Pseudomonas sp. PA15(2017)]|uniref:hypothetical protein n=1 Tax=Pseudomonas sp. PA15(2017) TaxID=1932111 RepID=UPI00117B45AE|nr:hypothetical protein [Pseudomonas sp. PA15(2017)]